MADQGRWFKLWCSAPFDPDLQALPPALRWAWAALGCYMKQHGTTGTLVMNSANPALAVAMGIPDSALLATIQQLPHVRVEEGKPRHGFHTVTFTNWHKYQSDTTMAERARTSRSKRRREERRREERRREEKKPPLNSPPDFLSTLRKNPAYTRIDLDRELAKMDAWLATPAGRGRKKTPRFILNWLNKIEVPLDPTESDAPFGVVR